MPIHPRRIARAIERRALRMAGSLEAKIKYDALDRPQFGYGLYHAAAQAKALGYERMSVIEFGVAGGTGLLALERIASETSRRFGLAIEVYGFDTGAGQPPAEDYRDAPFIWKQGQFRIDLDVLRPRLQGARLLIGDVADTIPTFMATDPAPIGFISFDMDYYSSTVRSFALLDEPHRFFLPRAFCYFDDIVGDDTELHCEYIGELLAIREFNETHERIKLALIHGLSSKRVYADHWHAKMFVQHRFDHPDYCRFINAKGDWQLELR